MSAALHVIEAQIAETRQALSSVQAAIGFHRKHLSLSRSYWSDAEKETDGNLVDRLDELQLELDNLNQDRDAIIAASVRQAA